MEDTDRRHEVPIDTSPIACRWRDEDYALEWLRYKAAQPGGLSTTEAHDLARHTAAVGRRGATPIPAPAASLRAFASPLASTHDPHLM